jgi:hypothetical protein
LNTSDVRVLGNIDDISFYFGDYRLGIGDKDVIVRALFGVLQCPENPFGFRIVIAGRSGKAKRSRLFMNNFIFLIPLQRPTFQARHQCRYKHSFSKAYFPLPGAFHGGNPIAS